MHFTVFVNPLNRLKYVNSFTLVWIKQTIKLLHKIDSVSCFKQIKSIIADLSN